MKKIMKKRRLPRIYRLEVVERSIAKLGKLSLENIDDILDASEVVHAIEESLSARDERLIIEFRLASGHPIDIMWRLSIIGRKASLLRTYRQLLPEGFCKLWSLSCVTDDKEIVGMLQLDLNTMTDEEVHQLILDWHDRKFPIIPLVTFHVRADTPNSKLKPLLEDIIESAFTYGCLQKVDVSCKQEIEFETPEDMADVFGEPSKGPDMAEQLRLFREHALKFSH